MHPSRVSPANRQFILPVLDASWPMKAGKPLEQEKDKMEEFKHSPSVQLISRLTGLNLQQSYWLSVIINFAVIAAVSSGPARKFLPGIFRDRTAAIQKAMKEAQKASEEARHKLAEIESRLRKLDDEIGAIRDAAQKEGAAEEARIQAAAQEDAQKIISSSGTGDCRCGESCTTPTDCPCGRSRRWSGKETDSCRLRD